MVFFNTNKPHRLFGRNFVLESCMSTQLLPHRSSPELLHEMHTLQYVVTCETVGLHPLCSSYVKDMMQFDKEDSNKLPPFGKFAVKLCNI